MALSLPEKLDYLWKEVRGWVCVEDRPAFMRELEELEREISPSQNSLRRKARRIRAMLDEIVERELDRDSLKADGEEEQRKRDSWRL